MVQINMQKGICNSKTICHYIQSHGRESCFLINLENEGD